MQTNHYITSFCHIKNQTVSLNNTVVYQDKTADTFTSFIKGAYKSLNTSYSKFFKMDSLSKLAFLAADVLLQNEHLNIEEENNIAVVLSNRASSLDTDRAHQNAIQNKNDYFPSPAVFVYTLPNICIGEISIKYKLYSENSFFIFDSFNAQHLFDYSNSLLASKKTKSVLCGWVDFDKNHYEAFLYLVSETSSNIEHNKNNINTLYNT